MKGSSFYAGGGGAPWADAPALARFYRSEEGRALARAIGGRMDALWPGLGGDGQARIAGLGYAAPYLALWPGAARRCGMGPARQGALRWPEEAASRMCLGHSRDLPFPDNAFSHVLLIHGLDPSGAGRQCAEAARILAPEGRLIVAASNRWGAHWWLRRTPFGKEAAFGAGAVRRLMRRAGLTPEGAARVFSPILILGARKRVVIRPYAPPLFAPVGAVPAR